MVKVPPGQKSSWQPSAAPPSAPGRPFHPLPAPWRPSILRLPRETPSFSICPRANWGWISMSCSLPPSECWTNRWLSLHINVSFTRKFLSPHCFYLSSWVFSCFMLMALLKKQMYNYVHGVILMTFKTTTGLIFSVCLTGPGVNLYDLSLWRALH